MAQLTTITPFLWYDRQAEEAATFYTSIFPGSRIRHVTRYGDAGANVHKMPAGAAMTVSFELSGRPFIALNGGPAFRFNESVSFQVSCDNQEEIDRYWGWLTSDGDETAQRCGWLKDKFGLSWQIVSPAMHALLGDPDPAKASRAMTAMLGMTKIDLAAMERAANG